MAHQDAQAAAAAAQNPAAALGVPSGLALTQTVYGIDRKHPLGTFAVTAPKGADELWVYHSFGNPYSPDERLIEKVAVGADGTATFVVGHAPFTLNGGGPYTLAVYGGAGGRRAPVPLVKEFQIPAYVAPVSANGMPEPVAWAQGQIQGDALIVPVLVGPPGAATTKVQFRHTAEPDIADSGAFTIVIDPATATALGLPNNGPVDASGVGGAAKGYYTTIDLEFPGNGARYNSEKAVVLPSFNECLIGLSFAVNHKYIFAVDTVRATLSYYPASAPTATAAGS